MTSWTSLEIIARDDAVAKIFFIAGGAVIAPACYRASIDAMVAATGFQAKPGRWLDLVGDGSPENRLIVIAIDDERGVDRWRAAGGYVLNALRALNIASGRLSATVEMSGEMQLPSLLEGVLLHGYRHDQARREPAPGLTSHTLLVDPRDAASIEDARRRADPVNRARAWVDQPANLLTPAVFAEEAKSALSALGVSVRVLGPAELEKMGAGGILAVAAGSENEPRLVVAEWRGASEREGWDAALVGKGLTFDAGGLNLKPSAGINKMKFDMAGGAAVLGAMERLVLRNAAANVVAIVPMAENNIDGKSYRPGDVLTSLSGLTIDVQNTDAEGRIVLADGITYAIDHYDPRYIVDVATLTGAITNILHEDFGGLFTTDDSLAASLSRAGDDTQELLWRLPLAPSMDYLVESPVADVSNVGVTGWSGLGAGSPVAGAKFIERFAKDRSWAHLDIAGTGWATRKSTRCGLGPTGFGVALLDRWIELVASNLE